MLGEMGGLSSSGVSDEECMIENAHLPQLLNVDSAETRVLVMEAAHLPRPLSLSLMQGLWLFITGVKELRNSSKSI